MTCASCRHAIGTYKGLWCQLRKEMSRRVCGEFEREPGSDEDEVAG